MIQSRIIPCLLLDGAGLVKTVRFRHPKYVGDPINAVHIFNEKFVDEIMFLDISATPSGREPNYAVIEQIAGECFIPFCYGGGVRTVQQAKRLFALGVEKVAINSAIFETPSILHDLAAVFGSQSIVAAMDVGTTWLGRRAVVTKRGRGRTKISPADHARRCQDLGAGELLVNDVSRDGVRQGYDTEMIASVSKAVDLPVIACGGAGNLIHVRDAIRHGGASAAAAGSLFVFKGRHRAVLINYPTREEIQKAFSDVTA